MIPTLTNAKIK